MERVYIGLGSNRRSPAAAARCPAGTGRTTRSRLAAVSSLYASDPLGPADQPRYVNAVAALETDLEPLALLDALQRIELAQGRERKAERWGPRTLDLDILLFGERLIDQPRLRVPHYHMQARAFVLYPLAEIAPPELVLADGRRLVDLLAACPFRGLERLFNTSVTDAVTNVTRR